MYIWWGAISGGTIGEVALELGLKGGRRFPGRPCREGHLQQRSRSCEGSEEGLVIIGSLIRAERVESSSRNPSQNSCYPLPILRWPLATSCGATERTETLKSGGVELEFQPWCLAPR